jgi:Flp pilus assembly protein TadB
LGLGVTTTQQKHTETSKPNTIQQHNKNIEKRQTQYNTTTQQKHTESSRPNTIQQHNKNIQKRQDPIVLGLDVSVCFCCVVVLYWVLTFLYVFVVLLYTIQQHNKNIQKRQTQYNPTTQQKHTESSRPNTIQQHNKNIQKRQLLYCIGS